MRLGRFIAGRVTTRIIGALLVVFALLQVLDLLEMTARILDRGLGFGGVIYYAALRSPGLVEQAMPIAVLAGGLFAFAQFARETAVTAMRAVGVSVYSLLLWAMPVALAVFAIQAALDQWVKPKADIALQEWWEATAPPDEEPDPAKTRTFRVGSDIVTAGAGTGSAELSALRIYRRDRNGQIVQRIAARSARFEDGVWKLSDVGTITIEGERAVSQSMPSMDWQTGLRPADIAGAFANTVGISPGDARRALGEGAALRAPAYYEMRLQRAWAGPAGVFVMLLLSLPVALANFRGGSGSMAMTTVLGAGMLFLVFDGLLTALGESGAVPVFLAAWAAPFLFAALGLMILLRREG